jgi:ABC-2 type transport system permease protein
MGSFEMFRVAPLNFFHLLLGKTLAYTLYVLVAAGALMLLLRVLNVPFLGSPLLLAGLVLLLTLSSVGIGLLVSALSTSDSQAVQLTMITLLLSIFFTGFFLPLQGFTTFAKPISAMIPMTHGLNGLQEILLVGRIPKPAVWLGLASIGLAAYSLVFIVAQRAYRKVVG